MHAVTLLTIVQLPPLRANVSVVTEASYLYYFRLLADHDPATRIALLSHVFTIWKIVICPC